MTDRQNLSLNELESLAKRAARGGGYPWGLCEEAGKAVRWLCVHGLDGAGQLAALLKKSLADSLQNHRPGNNTQWQSDHPLCPLVTGAFLSDSANNLNDGDIEIRQLLLPTILLPFAANVALLTKQTISIVCNDTQATTDGSTINIAKPFPDCASDVSVMIAGAMSAPGIQQRRVIANTDQLRVLQHYADLTYAPATEESRLSGAGAGLSDND